MEEDTDLFHHIVARESHAIVMWYRPGEQQLCADGPACHVPHVGMRGMAEYMSEMDKCVRWGKARESEQRISSNPLSCISVTLIAQGRHSRLTVMWRPHGSPMVLLCPGQGIDHLNN